MINEKIFIAFVYKKSDTYVLVVPDIPNLVIVAKTQYEVINKAINDLEKNFKEEIKNISPNSIKYFMNEYKNDYIPKNANLYPLTV